VIAVPRRVLRVKAKWLIIRAIRERGGDHS
jgi:hypothetical protein